MSEPDVDDDNGVDADDGFDPSKTGLRSRKGPAFLSRLFGRHDGE